MIYSIDHNGYVDCGPYFGLAATVVTLNAATSEDGLHLEDIQPGRSVHFICASEGSRRSKELRYIHDNASLLRRNRQQISVQIRPGMTADNPLADKTVLVVEQEDHGFLSGAWAGMRSAHSISVRGWPGGSLLSDVPPFIGGNFLILSPDEMGYGKVWVSSQHVPWRILPYVDLSIPTPVEIEEAVSR